MSENSTTNSGVYDFSRCCTRCGKESSTLVTESARRVDGELVHLITKGERLCPQCANERGHKSLPEIEEEWNKINLLRSQLRKEVRNVG